MKAAVVPKLWRKIKRRPAATSTMAMAMAYGRRVSSSGCDNRASGSSTSVARASGRHEHICSAKILGRGADPAERPGKNGLQHQREIADHQQQHGQAIPVEEQRWARAPIHPATAAVVVRKSMPMVDPSTYHRIGVPPTPSRKNTDVHPERVARTVKPKTPVVRT